MYTHDPVAPHFFFQLSLSPLYDHVRAGSLASVGGSLHPLRHRLVQRNCRVRCDTLRPGEPTSYYSTDTLQILQLSPVSKPLTLPVVVVMAGLIQIASS